MLLRLRDYILVGIRINAAAGIGPASEESTWTRDLVQRLVKLGIAVISISGGLYTVDRKMIYPLLPDTFPYYSATAELARNHPQCLFGFVGGIVDLRTLPTGMPDNILIEVGRALIADSQYASKFKAGRVEEIQWCARTNRCHYFSRGRPQIECGVNLALRGD